MLVTTDNTFKSMINNIYGLTAQSVNMGYIHLWRVYIHHKPSPDKMGEVGAYLFYIERLFATLNYGERSGMEIVKTVCRCAFNDEVLTEEECISIINICHSPEWHKIFMEVNYNEGWN